MAKAWQASAKRAGLGDVLGEVAGGQAGCAGGVGRAREPNWSCRSSSRLMTCAWMDTSRAENIAQRGADGAFRNNAVVVRPDGHVDRYAKIHPFSFAGENKEYTAGGRFLTVTLDDVRVSAFVCYDLRFADEFWGRALDTDLYVVSANWPSIRVEHWRALLRARAIENQAYVLGVNRVGRDRELDYPGASALIDPVGVTVFGGGDRAAVLSAEMDPGAV